jgi:hypothetical protein
LFFALDTQRTILAQNDNAQDDRTLRLELRH